MDGNLMGTRRPLVILECRGVKEQTVREIEGPVAGFSPVLWTGL